MGCQVSLEESQLAQLRLIRAEDSGKTSQAMAGIAADIVVALGEAKDMDDLEETPKGGVPVDLEDLSTIFRTMSMRFAAI